MTAPSVAALEACAGTVAANTFEPKPPVTPSIAPNFVEASSRGSCLLLNVAGTR